MNTHWQVRHVTREIDGVRREYLAIFDADGFEVALVNPDRADRRKTAELLARAPEMLMACNDCRDFNHIAWRLWNELNG